MLQTEVLGIKFRNPLVLASGILGTTSDILIRMAESGAGAVTMKSIGPVERKGHANPNIVEFEGGLLNAIGLPSPGYKEMGDKLEGLKKCPVPLFASIYGSTIQDFVNITKYVAGYKPSAIELDISCANKDDGMRFSSDPELTRKLVSQVKKHSKDIPIIAKLTPNTSCVKMLARACKKGGADALNAINTASGMIINIEARKPVLKYKKGGVSGPALKPIAVRCVYEAYEATGLPIIGTGGVTYGRDAIEMIMAGASLVGVGSAIHYRGIDAFRLISREMQGWMKKNGVKSVKEIVGAAHG